MVCIGCDVGLGQGRPHSMKMKLNPSLWKIGDQRITQQWKVIYQWAGPAINWGIKYHTKKQLVPSES